MGADTPDQKEVTTRTERSEGGERASAEGNVMSGRMTPEQTQIIQDMGFDRMSPIERHQVVAENFDRTNDMVGKIQSGRGSEVPTEDLAKQIKVNDALATFQMQETLRATHALAGADTMAKQPSVRH